jgi:hypothetical protein
MGSVAASASEPMVRRPAGARRYEIARKRAPAFGATAVALGVNAQKNPHDF